MNEQPQHFHSKSEQRFVYIRLKREEVIFPKIKKKRIYIFVRYHDDECVRVKERKTNMMTRPAQRKELTSTIDGSILCAVRFVRRAFLADSARHMQVEEKELMSLKRRVRDNQR